MQLKKQWVKEEIKEEIKKYFWDKVETKYFKLSRTR